jgi:hypothetical protein
MTLLYRQLRKEGYSHQAAVDSVLKKFPDWEAKAPPSGPPPSASPSVPPLAGVAPTENVPLAQGLLHRGILTGAANLLSSLFPSSMVDLSGQAPGAPETRGAGGIADLVSQPGTGEKVLGGAIARTPEPQGLLQRSAVSGFGAALPALVMGGPAAVLPAVASSVSGEAVQDTHLPEFVKRLIPVAVGMGPVAQAAQGIRRVAAEEPVQAETLVHPGEPGVTTLARRVEQPLAKALRVEPADARQVLSSLDEQVSAINEQYKPLMGTPDHPTMVTISPRLAELLRNETIRDGIRDQIETLNNSLYEGRPRPPIPEIYNKAGALVAKEIPLEVLDKAKQGLDRVVSKAQGKTSLDRYAKRDITDKAEALRTAADEQMQTQGDNTYAQVRAQRTVVEANRDATFKGLNLFKAAERDERGATVPRTTSSIKDEMAAMSPDARQHFRQGVYTSVLDRLSRGGKLTSSESERFQATLPPGADAKAAVQAIRAAATRKYMAQAGGEKASVEEQRQQAITGGLELASGISRRGRFHLLKSLIGAQKTLDPKAQAAIQEWLLSGKAGGPLLQSLEAQDATRIGGLVGALLGAQPR